MTHVLTSTRLGWVTPPPRQWSDYSPYTNWVQTDPPYVVNAEAVGIKTYWYSNPNRQMNGQDMFTPDESTFAHDCNGQRIYDTTDTRLKLMNPASQHLWSLWVSVSQAALALAPYTAVFEDDTSDVYGLNALPCNYDQQQWLNESMSEASQIQAAGIPLIYNGLSPMGPGPSVSPNIVMNQYTIGGMMEGCYMRPSTTNEYVNSKGWAVVEDTEIQMRQADRLFWCYADDYDAPASQVIPLRIYAFASFLMSYDPSTSIYETNFINLNDFNVMPESGLVALRPLTPAPNSAADLLTSTGVYGREYGACYLHGNYVGKCAAIANTDPFKAHGNPYAGYTRTMVLHGGDPLSGGTVSVNGGPAPGSIAPLGAYIMFKD